jgi:hypothetical protein
MTENESPNGPNATTSEVGTPEGVNFLNTDGVLTVHLDAFDSATLKRAQEAIASRWFRDKDFEGMPKIDQIFVDFNEAPGSNTAEVYSQLIAPLERALPNGGDDIIAFMNKEELIEAPEESLVIEGPSQMSGVTIQHVRDTLDGNA